MTSTSYSVELVLADGPVQLPTQFNAGVSSTHNLWEGISATEHFPSGASSASYTLTISKPVRQAAEVTRVEAELVNALKILAATWPFAGGAHLTLTSRSVTQTPRFQSNAEAVLDAYRTALGRSVVSKSVSSSYEAIAGYRVPPLSNAAQIGAAAYHDFRIRLLLQYYHHAWLEYYARSKVDRSSWFISLFKVGEVLEDIYGSREKVQNRLPATRSEWKQFAGFLNDHDLRHAQVNGVAPVVSRNDVDTAYYVGREWITRHLQKVGLPTA